MLTRDMQFLTVDDSNNIQEYAVGGATFAPVGDVTTLDGWPTEKRQIRTAPMDRLVEICAIANDAKIAFNEVHPQPRFCLPGYSVLTFSRSCKQETGVYSNVGEPTEAAMKVLVEKLGSSDDAFNATLSSLSPVARTTAVNDHYDTRFSRLLTFEFSRDRKSMSVLARDGNATVLLVKGAPESVLDRCTNVQLPSGVRTLNGSLRSQLDEALLEYGKKGLRTLALAYVDETDSDASHYSTDSSADYVKFERDMTFVGFVGMQDPPRPEVRAAIAKCRAAGIRTICITGDNKNTAETICREIGIFGQDEDLAGKSFTGREFEALSHEDKLVAVQRASLFSRTEPTHKSELVDLLQSLGLVVAMVRVSGPRLVVHFLLTVCLCQTGDGVNDAPALAKAECVFFSSRRVGRT